MAYPPAAVADAPPPPPAAPAPVQPKKRTEAQLKKFLKLARDRFSQAQTAEKDQRERELQDLRFYAGDQWPKEIKDLRAGQKAENGLPPVPARPCITINKTREPVRQVLNQERQSDMGIEIVPADDFGEVVGPIDETEIQLREGLVRRIQRESKAADARTWAFARAVQAGRGFYGVMTRFVPGKTNDQEIYIHRYYNQACVTLDPTHEQPDGSDAEWGFVGTDMPWDAYKAEFKKRNNKDNTVCGWSDDDWRAKGDELKDWFVSEGDTRTVRVVDYWYTVRSTRELVTFSGPDGSEITEWADEVPDAPAGYVEIDGSRREVIEKSIKWAKIDGCDDDVLEETDWPGPDMPIVKVLGEELQPYDKERRVEGMIRPMREPGQGFNYMISRWVEMIGLSPLSATLMAAGQDEGFEEEWNAINTRTLGRVHYNQKDSNDNPAPPPFANPAQNIPIEAIARSVQMFDQALQSTSGIEASALGQADSSVRSNKQARLLVEQSKQGSSHFLDNLQRSMRYEAQITNNLLYPIYGRKGRIARILNKEGDAEHVLLHQPMVMQDGKPVPAQAGTQDAKTYTLTKDAQFNCILKISKNYDSRRMEEAETLGQLLQAEPQLMTWFGDLFFQNQDGPGHQQMADRVKVMLDPKIQQMIASKANGQNVPPEVQAQIAGAQQQVQELTAQLQEATKPGAVEQIKQQGQHAIKDMELTFQAQKAAADNETKIAVAELGAKVDRLALFLEERARIGVQSHEVGMKAMDQTAAAGSQAAQQGHEQDMATSQQQETAAQADAARQHEAEMAAQQPQGAA